jgi:2',3'-cyclic-nucleotide 2'-phosphodiesterase (5'-nucleotidase family)
MQCQTGIQTEQADSKPADRITIIGINDIYRIEGVANGTRGGMARVRTLREEFSDQGEVLILHGGDALSPAAMSLKFGGQNMVDIMNHLDGDADAFDEHLFITFGNHEFDLKDGALLDTRVEESQFTWINSNIVWAKDDQGNPIIEAENEKPTAVLEVRGRKIGIYGMTLDKYPADFITKFEAYEPVARELIKQLRDQGAELVIGLTHLAADQDKELVEALGDAGPDVVFGGHDHKNMIVEADNGVKIIKADADAVTAQLVHIDFDQQGSVTVTTELRTLDERVPLNPFVQKRVEEWLKKYDPTGELAEPVGFTQVELDAEELDIRRFETNLGNWVTDQMMLASADVQAQAAMINSGTLRLNDIIIPGPISMGHLAELLPYQTDMVVKTLTGEDIIKALKFSITDWFGTGHFLQISHLKFTHDVTQGIAKDFQIKIDGTYQDIDPKAQYRVVLGSYIAKGGDGYDWFGELETVKNSGDLKSFLIEQLKAAGETGIAPQVEGRITTVGATN